MTQQRHQLVECGQSGHVQGQRAALGDGTLKKEREREEGRERRKKKEEEEERGGRRERRKKREEHYNQYIPTIQNFSLLTTLSNQTS